MAAQVQQAPNTPLLLLLGGLAILVFSALPLPIAALVAVGLPLAAIAAVQPRIGILLVLISIPLSSHAKVTLGAFDIAARDPLIAVVALGWITRGVIQRDLRLRPAPTIFAGLTLFTAGLLSTAAAEDFPSALKELLKLGEMITIALYAASTLDRREALRFVVLAMIGVAALEAIVGLFQFVTGRGPATYAIGPFMRAYGDFQQPNAFAGYLAMVFPLSVAVLFAGGRDRTLALLPAALIAGGILASLSRGAWMGTALALAVMALAWGPGTRRGLLLALPILPIGLILAWAGYLPTVIVEHLAVIGENFGIFDARKVDPTPTNWSVVERMAHWQAGWYMGLDNPLFGVGPGNYEAAYPRYLITSWNEPLGHSHNYYLNTFAEMGMIGLVAFVGFLAMVFGRIISAIRAAERGGLRRAALVGALGAAVALSVHNTFDNMFVQGIGVQFGLVIGVVEAVTGQIKRCALRSTTQPR